MIREVEFYHGAALARLCRKSLDESHSIQHHGASRSAYILDDTVALYVKHSTKRMSPWPFSFAREHQEEIAQLGRDYSAIFVVLVCGSDGIACLSEAELQRVLDDDYRAMEWVKAARRSREKYSITGSDGRKLFKVGDNEYPSKVLEACRAAQA